MSAAVADASAAAAASQPTPAQVAQVARVSRQFEAVFISQFLGSMFSDMPTDGPFDGGPGEAMFRSLEMDEYGKEMAARGGFGLSAAIQRTLLSAQERLNAKGSTQ